MACLRFLIDDVPACLTQRAVLADFAALLEARACGSAVEVLWSSALRGLPSWTDVPPESSRRLAVRLAALAPLPDTVTIFVPAHALVQPLDVARATAWRPGCTLACDGFPAIADLDLFAVANASPEVAALQAFLQSHTGYDAASRYDAFTTRPLPAWLVTGGLSSARLFTHRPWYSVQAPQRGPWLQAVGRALDSGRLTLGQVADDVRRARVRPSLLEDVAALRGGAGVAGGPDLALDALFIPPECRLTGAQRVMLHSQALQCRTLAFARRRATRKEGRWPFRLPSLRQAWRAGWRMGWRMARRALAAACAASLRLLVHRLRSPGGARP